MTPDQDLGFTLLSCQAGEILVTQMSATMNENASLVIDNILGLLNWCLKTTCGLNREDRRHTTVSNTTESHAGERPTKPLPRDGGPPDRPITLAETPMPVETGETFLLHAHRIAARDQRGKQERPVAIGSRLANQPLGFLGENDLCAGDGRARIVPNHATQGPPDPIWSVLGSEPKGPRAALM